LTKPPEEAKEIKLGIVIDKRFSDFQFTFLKHGYLASGL
jgi:hypothetical protein